MSSLKRFASYLVGTPKLYKIYRHPTSPSLPPPVYTPSVVETVTSATITYVVPITLLLSAYHRKLTYIQFAICAYVTCQLLRTFSRLTNREYMNFLRILEKATESDSNTESLEQLRCYDFEFKYFPVLHTAVVDISDYMARQNKKYGVDWYVSWLIAHSFGIRLIYPGLLLGSVLKNVLDEGRDKLLNEKGGVRVKVRAQSREGSGVDIDACVFDRRGNAAASYNANTLVICCEGNAGFYEIGMLGGALSEGYSVLGWNHPGFGGSTGTPYPSSELTAALGMMDYATTVLGFKETEIIVYGWSIGGFPATYLASRYQNLKGLLLDATFDDILPLALPRMPEFMSSLVVSTIRNHVNLNNTENLEHYSGPIRIVRRVDDEIISDPPGVLQANRGNYLLLQVVLKRVGGNGQGQEQQQYVDQLRDWINVPHDREVVHRDCLSGDNLGTSSSMNVRFIEMASSILRDYKSTHCTPLPREFYRIRSN